MSSYHKYDYQRQIIVTIMKQGGYFERIMDSGPELNRVKNFLHMLEGKTPLIEPKPYQHPTFLPIFPGLNARPFHNRQNDSIAQYLEGHAAEIKRDVMEAQHQALKSENLPISWKVHPLWYLGVDLSFLNIAIPNVKKIVCNLPRSAQSFPLAEAIVSWLDPYMHLPAHSSTDGLRCRYSLGVIVEDFCELRVGENRQQWTEGQCIIFEDCFEHEAWNGPKDRAVLIVDTWHPDLTAVEIEALTAGFRKREIREVVYQYRPLEAIKALIYSKFKLEEQVLSAKYWNSEAFIDPSFNETLLSKLHDWKNISVQFKAEKVSK